VKKRETPNKVMVEDPRAQMSKQDYDSKLAGYAVDPANDTGAQTGVATNQQTGVTEVVQPAITDAAKLKQIRDTVKKAHSIFKRVCEDIDTVCATCQGIVCDNNPSPYSGMSKAKTTRDYYMRVRLRLVNAYGGVLPQEVESELPVPRSC